MKNKIKTLSAVLLAILVIFAMCACSNEETDDTISEAEGIDAIFEVENVGYGQIAELNHKNLISDELIRSVNAKVVKNRNVALFAENKNLNYDSTVFYPIGNLKVNKYLVSGTKDNYIYLNEDGTINMILYTFAKLDILPGESHDVINSLLTEKLKDIVNLSEYQYMNVNGESVLYFTYYNMQDGYMTDFVRATVTADGNVSGFSIDNVGADTSNVQIDKDLAEELLTAKLKDMYDTETTTYKSHHLTYTPLFRVYNDELCVEYDVGVEYELKSQNITINSFIERILIPVRLMSATNTD